ncbi:uncharacterized protein LOC131145859 [Malania oleifera]|uniref:uncharacterized protein LOC131145859 n=1 Tax=Malania oleifera TaxID=397392 RepID=UPI0025ADD284|nr:uncharacterized protein LOC131145859 [Malania oleifera]
MAINKRNTRKSKDKESIAFKASNESSNDEDEKVKKDSKKKKKNAMKATTWDDTSTSESESESSDQEVACLMACDDNKEQSSSSKSFNDSSNESSEDSSNDSNDEGWNPGTILPTSEAVVVRVSAIRLAVTLLLYYRTLRNSLWLRIQYTVWIKVQQVDYELVVATLSGSIVVSSKVISDFPLEIYERVLPVNLIVFDMHGFDIILEMDWLSTNYASIDYHRREVVFRPPGEREFKFLGFCVRSEPRIFLAMHVRKLLLEGCQGYLEFVKDTTKEKCKLEGIPIVCEFPEDLPGLPPNREVEFVIELDPSMAPISKAPYRIAPSKL